MEKERAKFKDVEWFKLWYAVGLGHTTGNEKMLDLISA